MTKYRINTDRVREMCDAFTKYDVEHPKALPIDVLKINYNAQTARDINFCGTPGSHAGLFGVLFLPEKFHFSDAANAMGQFLMEPVSGSRWWHSWLRPLADKNRFALIETVGETHCWPNIFSDLMFGEASAFCCGDYSITTQVSIENIVKTWTEFADEVDDRRRFE